MDPMSEGYAVSDWLEGSDDDDACTGYRNGCDCSKCFDKEAGY